MSVGSGVSIPRDMTDAQLTAMKLSLATALLQKEQENEEKRIASTQKFVSETVQMVQNQQTQQMNQLFSFLAQQTATMQSLQKTQTGNLIKTLAPMTFQAQLQPALPPPNESSMSMFDEPPSSP
jgi:hypothetical protein